MKKPVNLILVLVIAALIFSCSSGSKDNKTEEEFYAEAQEFSEQGDYKSAIKAYQDILKTYPDSPRAYKAQFLIGFVYSENLKDYENAKENYRKVIEQYPDCDLADDAQYMLETMGKENLPTLEEKDSTSSD